MGASPDVRTGTDMQGLARLVAQDLNEDHPVALGFECPLFVPLADEPQNLTRARHGEGSRSWSAGAGTGALATGLVQTAWILRRVKEELKKDVPVFMDWDAFPSAGRGLLLWEAFVTGKAKGGSHEMDAAIAVRAFLGPLPDVKTKNAIRAETVFSLIGAALLRTGWSTDMKLLEKACVVIKA